MTRFFSHTLLIHPCVRGCLRLSPPRPRFLLHTWSSQLQTLVPPLTVYYDDALASMGSGESTQVAAAAKSPVMHKEQEALVRKHSSRGQLRGASPFRDPAELIDKLDATVADVINLMLAVSRTTISRSGRNKETFTEMIATQLKAILALHDYLLTVPTAASGARDAEKEFQSCIAIMAESVLHILWEKIAGKYVETVEQTELVAPAVMIAKARMNGCRHHGVHRQAIELVNQMVHVASHLNDCRTQEEYGLLMDIQAFSVCHRFIVQLQRAQAEIDRLADTERCRQDLFFTGFMFRLAEGGVSAAQNVPMIDILKLGDTADTRQIPTIRIEQMSSLTGQASPPLFILLPANALAAATLSSGTTMTSPRSGSLPTATSATMLTAKGGGGRPYIQVLRSVNSSPLLQPTPRGPSRRALGQKGRASSSPSVNKASKAADAAAAATTSPSSPSLTTPRLAPVPVPSEPATTTDAEQEQKKKKTEEDVARGELAAES
jgi:hypothetical protein